MMWLIWAIIDHYHERRRRREALRDIMANNWLADWHYVLPDNKRRAARWAKR